MRFADFLKGCASPTITARVVVAMLCMVTIVTVTYGLAIFYGISLAEESLVGLEMESKLTLAASGQHPELYDRLEKIYADTKRTTAYPPVPERYRGLKEGFSESLGDADYFVYKMVRDGEVWVMEQDQFGFEAEELELYLQAAIGFLVVLFVSAVAGLWLARAVTLPVQRLADDVKSMAKAKTFRPLSVRPANDEIGALALTVESTLKQFNEALARERAFTADVSHELRTPLMVISSTAELLQLPASPEVQAQRIRRIEGACRRLSRLVRVFLELARGTTESTSEIVPWSQVLATAVTNWQAEAKKKGIALLWEDASTGNPQVNSAFAESVVDNLLRNALQYTDEGEIRLTLTDDAMTVADTGRGIPDGEKAQILQAFVRGESAPGEGYGWGLSLVRRICRHEGWPLSFADNAPRGTVFKVRFAAATPGGESFSLEAGAASEGA